MPAVMMLVLLFLPCPPAYSREKGVDEDLCTSTAEGQGACGQSSSVAPDEPGQSAPEGRPERKNNPEERRDRPAGKVKIPAGREAEDESSRSNEVIVYFFWGRGCPHCEEEKNFLGEMKKRVPSLTIRDFEVWYDGKNAAFLSKMAGAYGIKSTGVPVTFIGESAFAGFSRERQSALEKAIRACLEGGCINPRNKSDGSPGLKEESGGQIRGTSETLLEGNAGEGGQDQPVTRTERQKGRSFVTVPRIGEIDPSRVSLPFLTVAVAGMDSFNPCAFFVLFSMLGLLVHAGSRGRVLLIGGVFVFFSGLIYFLFMAAWLNLFMIMGHVALVTQAAGAASLAIAAINIKDFFLFKRGVSLTIPDGAKPGLFDRMRRLMKATSLPSILAGATVLAIAANSYEFLCTAGFPMVFTRILTLNNLPTLSYYAYLLLYNVIYIIPLAVIVVAFSISLGKRQLTEWQGRTLKLVSGTMMLGLGGVLFLKPALLNNFLTAVMILTGSLVFSAMTALLARKWAFLRRKTDTGRP